MRIELTDTGDVRFILTKAEVKCFVAYASKDVTRESVNAVSLRVKNGRCEVAATDGHRLVIGSVASPTGAKDKQSLVARVVLEQALKGLPAKGEVALIPNCTTVSVDIAETDRYGCFNQLSSRTTKLVDANYPPYDVIMTETRKDPSGLIGFNTRYLGDLALVADASGQEGLSFSFAGELDPAFFSCSSPDTGTEWRGALMPMRI